MLVNKSIKYQESINKQSKQHYVRIGINNLVLQQFQIAIHLQATVINIYSCTRAFVMRTLLMISLI